MWVKLFGMLLLFCVYIEKPGSSLPSSFHGVECNSLAGRYQVRGPDLAAGSGGGLARWPACLFQRSSAQSLASECVCECRVAAEKCQLRRRCALLSFSVQGRTGGSAVTCPTRPPPSAFPLSRAIQLQGEQRLDRRERCRRGRELGCGQRLRRSLRRSTTSSAASNEINSRRGQSRAPRKLCAWSIRLTRVAGQLAGLFDPLESARRRCPTPAAVLVFFLAGQSSLRWS